MPGIGFVRRPAGKQEMLPGRQKGKILMEDFSRDHTVREKPGQTDCNSAAEKGSAEISVCGTPVCDFIRAYQAQNVLRLHMPGHKGQGFPEALDVTEIRGLDPLYPAAGVILESEKNAAALFGSGRTVYSAEGSSLCIRAMLFLARMRAERLGIRPLILAGRNAHRTFLSAAALLGLEVRWLKGENLLTCRPSAEAVAAALDEPCDGEDACGSPEDRRSREDYPVREQPRPCLEEDGALPSSAFAAVYLTSPDYLGHRADIRAVAAVCRRRGVPLLVDNAHGAYLRFLEEDMHPLSLGADMTCDSAHKTLPVLTGGAYLHIHQAADPFFALQADRAMALFASTSPSWLILQSLDRCNAYLSGDYRNRLADFVSRVAALKQRLQALGFETEGDEPLKITLRTKSCGYTGDQLHDLLRIRNMECEFSDPDYLVMMVTPGLGADGLERIAEALEEIPRKAPIAEAPPEIPAPRQVMPLARAMTAPADILPAEESLGRILSAPGVSCPPAVPILISGERIDEAALRCFRYYGIKEISCVSL